MTPRPLTLPEVAEHLQCSVRTVERENNAGLYPRWGTGWESSMECADAIRALKEKP